MLEDLLRPGERIDLLIREDLKIIQSKEFFSFSLDAILLADFIELPSNKPFRYIDFCSGNGVIPFLLSARTNQELEGIEIQAQLVDMARRSAKLNNLEDRLTFINGDLREFKPEKFGYDIVSCNPPYFLVENSASSRKLTSHAIARHEITLTLEDWVGKARSIMKQKGKLYIVYRPERLDDLFECLLANNFSVNKLKFIYPKKGKASNMVLVEAIYSGGRQGVKVLEPLYVHGEDSEYTEEVRKIYFG